MESQLAVKIFTEAEKESWNVFVDISKWGDTLQFWEWGNVKKLEGWEPLRIGVFEVALNSADSGPSYFPVDLNQDQTVQSQPSSRPLVLAQVLIKKVPLLGRYIYIPHGPVFLEKTDLAKGLPRLVQALKEYAAANSCFAIEIEPKIGYSPGQESLSKNLEHFADPLIKEIFENNGFVLTGRNIQPRYKLLYDLEFTEEELLSLMKKNTRYNVRLAEKKGVAVTEYAADDPGIGTKLENFYGLLLETQQRTGGYPIRSLPAFQRLFAEFRGTDKLTLFEGLYNNDLVAANISQKTSFWASSFYAASNRLHTDVKVPYLLRWRAIQSAKKYGCKVYDFWGIIPDSEQHKSYSDTKLSFGGIRLDTYGVLALPLDKFKYSLWNKLVPLRASIMGLGRRLRF